MGKTRCLEQSPAAPAGNLVSPFPYKLNSLHPGGTHFYAPSLQDRVLSADGIGLRLESQIWGLSCVWTLGSGFLALCCTLDLALQSKLVWDQGRSEL